MARFGRDDSFSAARTVQIIASETNENFTVYTIEVTIGSCSWTVKHRYSEFHELHEKLVTGHRVDKGLLPPKKLFGNQSEAFIKKRQHDLQLYLQTVLNLLCVKPPLPLTAFLHFNFYEIHGITQTMAEDLYNRGESLLQTNAVYQVSPLQLHSLTERLKLPEPTCDSGDVKKDLGHILDFITRTKHLKITGGTEKVGTSNINMNVLPFDLSLFKSLHTLEVVGCNFEMVQGLETIKQTLVFLKVYHTATTIKEVLLQDVPQWKGDDGTPLVGGWDHVTHVDLSHNSITDIDISVQMLWRAEEVDLSNNRVEGVQHLQWLSHMTRLNLAHNKLRVLDCLHTKLGNLTCLLLNDNHIESLQGFSKLFSLEVLDVSHNNIGKVEDVRPVCQLPCLEKLTLTDNPVTLTVDYRTRILEMFGDRVGEVYLDGEKASQKEKDTVAVRLALQKARDCSTRQPRKNSSAASLSDVCGGRGDTPPPHSARHSPLPPCGTSGPGSSALGQGQKGGNCEMSSSAPHRQWSSPEFSRHSVANIFVPGRTSPGQISTSSCASVQEEGEGVDLPSPIPEAHPFDPASDALPALPSQSVCRKEYCVSDLPHTSSPPFLAWLQKHIIKDDPCPPAPAPSLDDPGDSHHSQDNQVVCAIWCYGQQYTSPAVTVPCCAVLTTTKLFVQRLSASSATADIPGCPDLQAWLMVPLSSVQHVVVGPSYAYLRVEEAFVGKGGLFTLFAIEGGTMKSFAEALQDCCTQLDPANPLDVLDLLCQSDLLTNLCHREKSVGLMSDYLAMVLLVRVGEREKGGSSLLVMSENVVYLTHHDCVYWPPPTFQSAHEGVLHLTLLDQVSVTSITDLSLHSPTPSPCLTPSPSPAHSAVQFSPLPLTLRVDEKDGPRLVLVYFSADSARTTFVDRVNSLRVRGGHDLPSVAVPGGDDKQSVDDADASCLTCHSQCSPPEGHSDLVPGGAHMVLSQPVSAFPVHSSNQPSLDNTVTAPLTDGVPPLNFDHQQCGGDGDDEVGERGSGGGGESQGEVIQADSQVSIEADVHSHTNNSMSANTAREGEETAVSSSPQSQACQVQVNTAQHDPLPHPTHTSQSMHFDQHSDSEVVLVKGDEAKENSQSVNCDKQSASAADCVTEREAKENESVFCEQNSACEGEMYATRDNTGLYANRDNTELYANRDDTELYANRDDTELYANRDDTELYANRDNTELYANRDNTELYTNRDNTELYANRDDTELYANRDDTELYANRDDTELYANRDDTELYANRDDTELYANRDDTELYANRDDTELYANRDDTELYANRDDTELQPSTVTGAAYLSSVEHHSGECKKDSHCDGECDVTNSFSPCQQQSPACQNNTHDDAVYWEQSKDPAPGEDIQQHTDHAAEPRDTVLNYTGQHADHTDISQKLGSREPTPYEDRPEAQCIGGKLVMPTAESGEPLLHRDVLQVADSPPYRDSQTCVTSLPSVLSELCASKGTGVKTESDMVSQATAGTDPNETTQPNAYMDSEVIKCRPDTDGCPDSGNGVATQPCPVTLCTVDSESDPECENDVDKKVPSTTPSSTQCTMENESSNAEYESGVDRHASPTPCCPQSQACGSVKTASDSADPPCNGQASCEEQHCVQGAHDATQDGVS